MAETVKFHSVRNQPFPSTIEVQFTHAMDNNAALTSPSTYTLDHGAYVTSVAVLDDERIRLTTENLFGYNEFVLTVLPGLLGSSPDGYDFTITENTITVSLTGDPEEQTNAISAANGRLKSGQKAIKVSQDANYFYIMTESGLDIVHRDSLFNKGFVLEEAGFNTIVIGGEDN